jgi:putative SOS response-associated peptidase YedK
MCGRFALHSHPAVVALEFGLDREPEFAARYNIAPSTEVLIVRELPGERRSAAMARWGLVPAWMREPPQVLLFNARAESAARKPAFRDAMKKRRCLIPASGFYEWKTAGGRKQPYYARPAQGELFALAGLYEECREAGADLVTCAILTTQANENLRGIHDRMPVIIAPADYARWLAAPANDPAEAARLLAPCPAERVAVHPVSPRVNSARLDDAELIAPVGSPATDDATPV